MGCGVSKISVIDPNVNEEMTEKPLNYKDSNKPLSAKKWLGPDDTITDRANLSGDFGDEVDNSLGSQGTSHSETQTKMAQSSKVNSENFPNKSNENQENSNFLRSFNSNFASFNVDFMGRTVSPECPFSVPLKTDHLPTNPLCTIQSIFSQNETIQNEQENQSESYNSISELRTQQFHVFSSRQIINRFTPEEIFSQSDNETNEIELSSTVIESNPIFGIRGTGDNNFDPSGLSFD